MAGERERAPLAEKDSAREREGPHLASNGVPALVLGIDREPRFALVRMANVKP